MTALLSCNHHLLALFIITTSYILLSHENYVVHSFTTFIPPSTTTTVSSSQHISNTFLLHKPINNNNNLNKVLLHSLSSSSSSNNENDNKKYQGNKGRNWIERSTPTGISTSISSKEESSTSIEIVEYTLQLDGDSFDLSLLSQRIYNALLSVASKRFENVDSIPNELLDIYKVTTMNLAAKEATKLALEQNNLQLVMPQQSDNEIDEDNWGEIDTITISDVDYTSVDDAIAKGSWEPGNTFSFLVRNVIAKEKEMDIKSFLDTLDPNGKIQQELNKREDMPDDPTERILCLKDLKEDNERRSNEVPVVASPDENIVYDDSVLQKNVLSFDRICDAWHGNDMEAYNTLMEALESNSYIVVELKDSNSDILKNMWNTVDNFFDTIDDKTLPSMDVVPEAGSNKAVVGYASYDNDSMQFLETRLQRMNNDDNINDDNVIIHPKSLFGDVKEDNNNIIKSFQLLSKMGKYISQIAIDASNQEMNIPLEKSKKYSKLVVNDLLDDGTYTSSSSNDDTSICMSPHRLCRYSYPKNTKENNDSSSSTKAKEIFGAHTDTSFVTIIPCASVAGLEVFNEDISEWVRPECVAKQHYDKYHKQNDSTPWCSNYVIILPGELLQLMTRSMIVSSIHRVISIQNVNKSRISAPILLRARSNKVMDVEKYFGSVDDGGDISFLLDDCEDMTMEEIHDALQP